TGRHTGQPLHLLGFQPRENRLAESRVMGREPTSHPGGHAQRKTATDLVQIVNIAALEDAEVGDHAGTQVHFLQPRGRSLPNRSVVVLPTAETEGTTAEDVSEGRVLKPVQAHQLIKNAV